MPLESDFERPDSRGIIPGEEEGAVAVFCIGGSNIAPGIAVDLFHSACFPQPIFFVVLNDAK